MRSITKNIKKAALLTAGALALIAGAAQNASADVLFATSYDQHQLWRVDTATQATTLVFTTPNTVGGIDSLIFTAPNNIVYTAFDAGQVRNFNLNTMTDTLITTSGGIGLSGPRDLVLDPSGTSVLVSDDKLGQISRVNLGTGVVTPFKTGILPDALVYTPTGRLFAVIGSHTLAELNPANGATIASLAFPTTIDLDGLTFDPASNLLYVSNAGANGDPNPPAPPQGTGLFSVPLTLATANPLAISQFTQPDGIVYNGAGHIFVATRGDFRIYDYNVATNTSTKNAFINGLDDLAPLIGGGSPGPLPGLPLPASVWGGALLGTLMVGMRIRQSRRQAANA